MIKMNNQEEDELRELSKVPKTTLNYFLVLCQILLAPIIFIFVGLTLDSSFSFVWGYLLASLFNSVWVFKVLRESKVSSHHSFDDIHLAYEAEPDCANFVMLLAIVLNAMIWVIAWPGLVIRLITGDLWEETAV